MHSREEKTSGFTLVELMLVVAIVGVLAAISIPSFAHYVQHAKTAEIGENLGALFLGATTYYTQEFTTEEGDRIVSSCVVEAVPHVVDDSALGSHRIAPSGIYVGDGAPASFSALGFSPQEPLYYAYNIASSIDPRCDTAADTEDVYIFEAAGDLNGDKIVEVHQMAVRSNGSNTLQRMAVVDRSRN